MGEEKILAIDWGDRKVLRYYYPSMNGYYFYDEITYDGEKFVVRSGVASDISISHKHVSWQQTYKASQYDVERFMKAFNDPWWSSFRDVWHVVTSLCPERIK